MSNEKLEMNKIESSPSVRRSNSYRVALRKSGISKEYIEELDRQLSVNEENQQQAASATANLPKDNNNEEEKKTLFKRNYRGLQNKRNATLTRKNGDTDESEVTIAISTNSMNSRTVDGKDGYETSELTNGKANTNRDNYTPKEDNQQHTESSHQSTCGHLLCLLCCCNYCVFLPQSVRSELRSSIHRDSNRSHLLESN